MTDKENDMIDTTELNRRLFLSISATTLAGLPMLMHSSTGLADGTNLPDKNGIIIDACGWVGNPNIANAGGYAKDVEISRENRWPEIDEQALRDAHKSGLTGVRVTLGHVFGKGGDRPFEYTVREIASWDARIRKHHKDLMKIYTGQDILKAKESGKVGIIFGFQNSEMLGEDASRVQLFADLGVRVIQLTYNLGNRVGDGSMAPENRGLTEFGREVIKELNTNQVLVDLSHGGKKLTLDTLHATDVPLAITHTGCRALSDHPRNKTDKELRLLAEKGGVAGIYWMPYLHLGRQVYAEDVVRHIEHAVNVCGEDHVGIGTDGGVSKVENIDRYKEMHRADVENRKKTGVAAPGETIDIVPFTPDMSGPDQFRKLANLLDKRGYGTTRIEKILGTNFFNLMNATWAS